MKQITLSSITVREIRYRPNDSEPNVTIFYDIRDSDGTIVGTQQYTTRVDALSAKTKTSVTSYLSNLARVVEDKDLAVHTAETGGATAIE